MNVIIIGGGYSGLAAALTLRQAAAATDNLDIVLADPDVKHLKTTQLHETLRRPLSQFQVDYASLAERLGFRFVNVDALPDVTPAALADYQRDRAVALDGDRHRFDYLLVASGASPLEPDDPGEHCYGLNFFTATPGQTLIEDYLHRCAGEPERAISVIGAGASGVQFVFELADAFKEIDEPVALRLIDIVQRPLRQQPPGVGRYVRERLDDAGIDFLPGCEFVRHRGGSITLRSANGGEEKDLPSQLCLLLLGREARPQRLRANAYGQVVVDGDALERVFAAGDCVSYDGDGLDAMTAQAAIRKAKLAAGNIARARRGESLEVYDYREVGYFVSLGDRDGAGWLNDRDTILTGLAAAMIKALIEKQYDLLLRGHDAYFDVNALQEKFAAFTD